MSISTTDTRAGVERPVTLLLVDDEVFTRRLVVRMLANLPVRAYRPVGHPETISVGEPGNRAAGPAPIVIEAANGKDALTALATNAVDGMIADFQMPGMNGVDLIRAVRSGATRANRALPIAMLTGYADSHLVGTALALDIQAFLAKPVAVATLAARLARMFADTGWQLRDAEAYGAVELPPALRLHRPRPKVSPETVWAEATREPAGEIVVGGLEPGPRRCRFELVPGDARLARPIYGPDDRPIVPAGAVLTPLLLSKLGDLRELGVAIDEVWLDA